MAGKPGARNWMRVLVKDDVERLKQLLVSKDPRKERWEYKPHRGAIIISVPIIPFNSKTGKPDPSMRYMAKHLRVSPAPGGPFQLEYMRHTNRWEPIQYAVGNLEAIADHIHEDACGIFGMFDGDGE